MIIKSLEELRQADERTLPFGPLGLGGRLRPEDAAEFQQQVVARCELVPDVTEGTRQSFEQLRTVFAYGVLCYDIFTVVDDRALLVFEQALRDRFIDFHKGAVTFTAPDRGTTEELAAERYEQVMDFIASHRAWKLQVGSAPGTMRFNGMLGDLRRWARQAGLLRGQRNRAVEQAITQLRNHAAHPSCYTLTTPVEAAITISDLAEIINHLWGATTPGGRLYPAPVRRTIIALRWNDESSSVEAGVVAPMPDPAAPPTVHHDQQAGTVHSEQDSAGLEPADDHEPDCRTYLLVRGVPGDWDLLRFDARYETGRYPAEWLWGPGSGEDAAQWLARERPADDQVDVLDRVFLLRYHGSLLYLPRDPDVAAGIGDEEKPGTWYLIRADAPDQAFSHQRQALAGYGCDPHGPCRQCAVETLGSGSWQEVMESLAARDVPVARREVSDARVPSLRGLSRCQRVGNGGWDNPEQER